MTQMTDIVSWNTDAFKLVHAKLADAETRLKAPLHTVMRRWVIEELTSVGDISRKLNVSAPVVERLVIQFALSDQVEANRRSFVKRCPQRTALRNATKAGGHCGSKT
jgi:hypothetical protein